MRERAVKRLRSKILMRPMERGLANLRQSGADIRRRRIVVAARLSYDDCDPMSQL